MEPGFIRASLRSILILSSHPRLALPKVLFPVGVPVRIFKHSYLHAFWLHVHYYVLPVISLESEIYMFHLLKLLLLLSSMGLFFLFLIKGVMSQISAF